MEDEGEKISRTIFVMIFYLFWNYQADQSSEIEILWLQILERMFRVS